MFLNILLPLIRAPILIKSLRIFKTKGILSKSGHELGVIFINEKYNLNNYV